MKESVGIIREIYAAASDQSRWQRVVKRIANSDPGTASSLIFFDEKSGAMPILVNSGYADGTVEAYNNYYHSKNLIAPLLRGQPPGTIVNAQNVEADENYRRSEYRNDFMIKQGLGGGGIINASTRGDVYMNLSIDFPLLAIGRHQENAERRLTELRAHLSHAFSFIELNRATTLIASAPNQFIEMIGVPAFLLDGDGRMISLNTRAQELMAIESSVRFRDGKIRFESLKAQAFVEQAVRNVVSGKIGNLPNVLVSVGSRGRMLLRVWPLNNKGNEKSHDYEIADLPPPLLCLTVKLLDESSKPSIVLARELFGLTRAEAQLAQAIASGTELNTFADSAHLSRHTVRNQLKAVFSKMGVSRQLELALLMQKLQE